MQLESISQFYLTLYLTGFEPLHYSAVVHLKQLDSCFLTIQAIESMNGIGNS